VDIVEAMVDPQLFEPWFVGGTWDTWRSVLKGAFPLPTFHEEEALFRTLAQPG
jgi:hypothetical protein